MKLKLLALLLALASPSYAATIGDDGSVSAGGGGGVVSTGGTLSGGTDTRVLFNDAGTIGEDAEFTYNKTTNTLTVNTLATSGTSSIDAASGGLDFVDSNTIFLGSSDSIDTAVTNATAGDTIVLASGTYTITDDIDVTKALHIKGQGKGKTVISTSTNNINIFDITASNVVISDLSISSTGAGANDMKGFNVNGTGGTVLSGVIIKNVYISMSGANNQFGIHWRDASGEIWNCDLSIIGTDDDAWGIYYENASTAEAATALNIFYTKVYSRSGDTSSYAFWSRDNSASQDNVMSIYFSYGETAEVGASSNGAYHCQNPDAFMYVYNSVANGNDFDLLNTSSCGGFFVSNSVLLNQTVSGVVESDGTLWTQGVMVDVIQSQAIASNGTITANQCGGVKAVTSASHVITNTTNTFTTPAVGNEGCSMTVVNVGSFNITLDTNSNFPTWNGRDIVLNPNASIVVASAGSGSPWYQITSPLYN